MAACQSAQTAINSAGGVRGQKVACTREDAGSDPADAVPAADKMLSSVKNLVAMIGPNAVAPATEPIIKKAGVVMLSESGDPRYDQSTDPFFFRITPADDVAGAAMAVWAIHSGLKHAAFVFDNDLGAQTSVPTLTYAYKKLGGTIATSATLVADQPSYKSEVESLLATHPDGIITETDPQTASTFMSELLQLNNGHFLPVQTDATNMTTQYEHALATTIGNSNMQKYFSGTDIAGPTPAGPAYLAFTAALQGSGTNNPSQFYGQVYVSSPYDSLIASALAMTAAKSSKPAVWKDYMTQVTGTPHAGSVTVNTYDAGVAALKKGQHITYVGANGALEFNKYQNNSGSFAAFGYNQANPEAAALYVIPSGTIAGLMMP
ncbi:ABC transporter substrate-binding protein [Acidothermaceae bacterium B102]|nr:ABC transporter substrate-binding protein [Acidothermaceae bacterium B102]